MKTDVLNKNKCPICGFRMIRKSAGGSSIIIPKYITVLGGGKIIAKCKRCGGFVKMPASIFRDKKVKYVVKNSN